MYFPYEFLEAEMTNDARDYLTALYVLKEREFNMLFCNNLAYFGVLLDRIDQHAERMIQDIREGVMSVPLKERDRAILEAGFIADEARSRRTSVNPDKRWGAYTISGLAEFRFHRCVVGRQCGRLF